MTIVLSLANYWELFDQVEQAGEIKDKSHNFETICDYPKLLGQGYCRDIQLRPGLLLTIEDYFNQEGWFLKHAPREHPLEFYCQISGLGAGKTFICSSGIAPAEIIETPANQRVLTVAVHMEPQLLADSVTGSNQLPKTLQPLIKSVDQPYDIYSSKITPALQITLQQILACPYQGFTRRMYLESKVLELIMLQLAQLPEADNSPRQTPVLRSADIERIHHAKEILRRNLIKSPSLLELARQVGLNDCTLKQGFRQVLGTTAFGYLRDCRMEQARQLLTAGQMSVKEVAHAVGYASPTSFSAAFRRKFGANPNSYVVHRHNREI